MTPQTQIHLTVEMSIFKDETNTSSKVRLSSVSRNTIMRPVHQFPFDDLNIWEMQYFLGYRKNKATSTEFKQLCNSSICKKKANSQ